ncbi:MAG: DNA alkylation repair protein [Deltaproteobacteria bacterium]|nr:DNA alkylation repair protein [Deltaproteobacteria bacterium]
MTLDQIVAILKALANPDNVAGMARYGISPEGCLGVPMPALRKMAGEIGRRHGLAEGLWRSGIHEARILAGLIDDPSLVTDDQMERWVLDIDSWDICDQLCSNLFSRTGLALEKAAAWSSRPETFVKRAGFVLMAALAVHDKKADDAVFASFLPLIAREAGDDRNFVKKAVNWALRQIGKRNPALNLLAVEAARKIREMDARSARWIAGDALRELTDDKSWYRWRNTGRKGRAAPPPPGRRGSS